MFTWPKLELSDWERRFVRPYSTQTRDPKTGKLVRLPGVLRRAYPRTVSNDTDIAPPSQQLQIARRARVLALTFSGDISYTRLQITNASGTTYTIRDARTTVDPYVSALIAGSLWMNGSALGGKPAFATIPNSAAELTLIDSHEQAAPLLIDPNWVLMPNETLIFNATFDVDSDTAVRILNIGIHVWEFPGMHNADKTHAEIV